MKLLHTGAIALAVATLAGGALAQSSVTVYGRLDLALTQQADKVANKEIRTGSGNRLGFRGTDDLGGGLKAVFQIEHRLNPADGSLSAATRFWDGKALVGLEGSFGRFWMGRDENPAYTYSQSPGDPWGTDTVVANGTIMNGGIGATRYSNTLNYRIAASGLTFAAQLGEAGKNAPAAGTAEKRTLSLGVAYGAGPLTLGLGYENPGDADDIWTTLNASYNFGMVKLGAFYGTGKDGLAKKRQSYLLSATAPIAGGELRLSLGQLKNKDTAIVLDKRTAIGYVYPLSKRTSVYADLVREGRPAMPAANKATGYDFGLKHNF
ncbi:MAG: porin [Burkholderiales bacterium]|nr:porin [Burkholderiales bacterium]MBP6675528.1 porin [Vitreoscilla sp.]